MAAALKFAYPVREGYVLRQGQECVVWREHLWNTGDLTRSWLVPFASVRTQEVQVRDLQDLAPDA